MNNNSFSLYNTFLFLGRGRFQVSQASFQKRTPYKDVNPAEVEKTTSYLYKQRFTRKVNTFFFKCLILQADTRSYDSGIFGVLPGSFCFLLPGKFIVCNIFVYIIM